MTAPRRVPGLGDRIRFWLAVALAVGVTVVFVWIMYVAGEAIGHSR